MGDPSKREIVLDTSWMSALLMALLVLVLAVGIGFDLKRIIHGRFLPPKAVINRWWDATVNLFSLFISLNLGIKGPERSLRFACGLFCLVFLLHLVNLFLPLNNSFRTTLLESSAFAGLAALVLLAIYVANWFRSKIVHV